MLLPAKTTRRKFYNKWYYKTTLKIPGCSILRTLSQDELKSMIILNQKPKYFEISEFRRKAWDNKELLLKVINFLSSFNKNEYSLRLERDSIDFYTNNLDFYNQINSDFSINLIHRFEPSEISKCELDNDSVMIVKKLPKNRYNYRVYLKPHVFKGDKESKTKFMNFLENCGERVSISDAVKSWFFNTDWNWDRRYILVEDEPTILMLKLRNSEVVGRIYKFIVR